MKAMLLDTLEAQGFSGSKPALFVLEQKAPWLSHPLIS